MRGGEQVGNRRMTIRGAFIRGFSLILCVVVGACGSKETTKLDPDNARIWWKLALAYEKKEDWQKMASSCTKAEEAAEKSDKKKTHADYYFRHGWALEQLADKGDGQVF